MQIVKKILSVTSKILIALLMLIMILTLILRISGSKFNLFGLNVYYIATPSMEPDLKVGDVILSKNIKDYSKLEIGDIISYNGEEGSYKGKLITHQIIDIKEENGKYIFITKGTNKNSTVDPDVREDQVVSKMLFEIPLIGKLVKLLSNKYAFFFILIVPLAIMLVFEFKNLFKIFKEEDEEEKKKEEVENEKQN